MEKNFGKGEAIHEIHVANILSNLAKKKFQINFCRFMMSHINKEAYAGCIGFITLCI
jgi:hypothetical protein